MFGKKPKLDYKSTAAEIKEVKEAEGIVTAYVSVFGVIDSYGDIVQKGAFAESIAKKLPAIVWAHDWEKPIGKCLGAVEDDHGLLVTFQLIKGVQQGAEALVLLQQGAVTEFSIGFSALEFGWDEQGHRLLKKVRLYECSPVIAGACPNTEITDMKANGAGVMVDEIAANDNGTIAIKYTEGTEQKTIVVKAAEGVTSIIKGAAQPLGKVEASPCAECAKRRKTILRVRDAAKENIQRSEFVLRITKP